MLTKLQLFKSATSIGMAIGAFAAPVMMAQANPSTFSIEQQNNFVAQSAPTNNVKPRRYSRSIALGTKINTVSGTSEVAFAEFLAANDVKFYGAYWCSHCQQQKSLFGAAAAAKLPYIECAKDGENSQRELCRTKGIKMFPTWAINGTLYPGSKNLQDIVTIIRENKINYTGPSNFQYKK
jgi:hypothetical protein